MVMEAQIESGVFVSQNEGGPLNVTKMLAAVQVVIHRKKLYQRRRYRHIVEEGVRELHCTYLQNSENSCPSTFKRHLRRGERRDFNARQCPEGTKEG
jgi:predicted GTPase